MIRSTALPAAANDPKIKQTAAGKLRRFAAAAILAAAVSGAALRVYAQADAAAAYTQGKEAFQKGEFDKARDAFIKASQTDPRNPEVFLWLGKAQYQLGAVDDAIVAWKRTLALAPEEPTANQMLKVLTGREQNADTSLKLVETLLQNDFYERAGEVADKLLNDKALTDVQRARALLLRATALIEINRVPEAVGLVEEALLKYPAQVDATEADLLLARGRLRAGGARLAEGVAALRKLVTEHANTPAGIIAQYELLAFDIEQDVNAAKADALARWVVAHPDLPQSARARRKVVDAYLKVTVFSASPAAGSGLAPSDKAALSFAAQVFGRTVSAGEALKLTEQLLNHFDAYYENNKAFAAAAAGADALLAIKELPSLSRSLALRASARYRSELALKELADNAAAGAQPAGAMPKALADVVAAYAAINQEFPSSPAWREQAALAERLRVIGGSLAWPAKVTELKPVYAWAVEIALPVVKTSTDVAAVEAAVKAVTEIVNDTSTLAQPAAKAMALKLNTQLLAALPVDNPSWDGVSWGQAALLDASAAAEFQENLRTGRPEQNAKLSKAQTEFIDLLTAIVKRDVRRTPMAIQRLRTHLDPWLNAGEFAVAEAAFARLAGALAETPQREMQLTIVRLWVQQAVIEHQRLAAAGLGEPRKLNDSLVNAAKRLYELQAGVAENDPFLGQVRSVLDSIVNHYRTLEYFELAEQVVRLKADIANPVADAYAQFQSAKLQDEAARRELTATLKQYKASEKLTLTEAAKAAIAAYEKFVTDHPTDPLAGPAAQGVFGVAQVYEDYGAHDVAAGIYRDFAVFAAKTKTLSYAAPGRSSFAERAAFAVAGAADVKARQAFAKTVAAQKDKPTPPQKISDEFAAALKVYREFMAARPDSVLVGAALQRVNAIALDYARADAWDVADGIYASLLEGQLKVREPARVEFCRGMCQVGKVMPEHAKEVLAAVLSAGTHGTDDSGVARISNEQKDLGYMDSDGKDELRKELAGERSGVTRGDAFGLRQPVTISGGLAMPDESAPQGGGFGGGGGRGRAGSGTAGPAAATPPPATPRLAPADDFAKADNETLAAISRQEARRASQIAAIRDKAPVSYRGAVLAGKPQAQPMKQAANEPQQVDRRTAQVEGIAQLPVLSEEELARQQKALDAAYAIFQSIKTKYPQTATADQARGEMMVAIDYWRGINQPQHAAALAQRYLKDNPTDPQLPQLRLSVALDQLAWAAQPLDKLTTSQQMLAEVAKRFEAARADLASVVAAFPDEKPLIQQAQWQIATSFLTQARVVDAFSPVLARGQYVRAATELQRVANRYADHPQMAQLPQMLWEIAQELNSRSYYEEAISVWNDLSIHYATHALAGQAKVLIAQAYQGSLGRPLRAAEVYLEINFARGGGDVEMQNAVFTIGQQLTQQKRWVEALHVLQVFVDSFPRHQNAGQALAMIGQIHQTNESWKDAIAAYQRVIEEYPASGQSLQEAKWAIAECLINLSEWKPAIEAYQGYVAMFAKDARVAEANRRIGILKDLSNFQMLVNENGPKAFDAQFQMATIIEKQLALQQKAVVEYQKVATNYPKSHLADDALYAIGLIYRERGEIDMARMAWRDTASKYPDSPLADDALYQIGKSYEEEAQQMTGLERSATLTLNSEVAQGRAYKWAQKNLSEQRANQVQKLVKAKEGSKKEAELQEASNANFNGAFDQANTYAAAAKATEEVQTLTAAQLADRQDKANAALRKAVAAYDEAAKVPGADKAGESLLRMAVIYNDRLGDSAAAMKTWLEIVRQFSGTAVAEEASWQIAAHYEKAGQYAEAVESYKAFLRNYRRSPKASEAQFFIAENYEHLNQWVGAMDQYTNYLNNFPDGPLAQKAREQISFIKTYRL